MSEAARQTHDFIHHSLETFLVLLGPDKEPVAVGPGDDTVRCNQLCSSLVHALDAVQKEGSLEDLSSRSPDQLARDFLDQLDEQNFEYKVDEGSNVLTIYGAGRRWGEPSYQGALPLDKWASFVSDGLASLRTLMKEPAEVSPGSIPETDREPSPLSVRVSPIDGLQYVWIPPGQFWMGALPEDLDARPEEVPRHQVRLTRGFWLSRGPVTVSAYQRFAEEQHLPMPASPHFNRNWIEKDHPIVRVTWYDAAAYCQWAGGRLPTEAEWEYAARGGADRFRYPWGREVSPSLANYSSSKLGGTCPVGSHPPNAFGLYELAGNVSEWCSDWFSGDYYSELAGAGITEDPRGPSSTGVRVLRGGSWCYSSRYLRVSYRLWFEPEDHDYDIGFRCVRESAP